MLFYATAWICCASGYHTKRVALLWRRGKSKLCQTSWTEQSQAATWHVLVLFSLIVILGFKQCFGFLFHCIVSGCSKGLCSVNTLNIQLATNRWSFAFTTASFFFLTLAVWSPNTCISIQFNRRQASVQLISPNVTLSGHKHTMSFEGN